MMILWFILNFMEFVSLIVFYGLVLKNYFLKVEGKFVFFIEGNLDGLKYIYCVVIQVR